MSGNEMSGFRPLSRLGRTPPLPKEGLGIAVVVPTTTQTESWGAWLALAFQRMGYDVRAFPYRDVAAESDPESMNRQLLRQVRRWNSQLVVVVKGELVRPSTLESLKKDGCRLVLLANDDHQVWEIVSKPLGRYCERVFTFTKGSLSWYEKEGIPAEHMLFYADPKVCVPKPTAESGPVIGDERIRAYDVSFVGTYYPEREPLISAIAGETKLMFNLEGDGWPRHAPDAKNDWAKAYFEKAARPEYREVLDIWHSSRICLNIHQDGLKKLGVVANLRCYELGASGCFMVSDYVEGMETAFGDPLPFKTLPDDWTPREKTDHIRMLAGQDYAKFRSDKSEHLRKIVLERHTPEKRAQQILDAVK